MKKNRSLLIFAVITLFYGATHFWNLAIFPVFADESIYIRWSQLIMDDWQRYLFFPMNDGKTPLFIWLLIPFQYLFANQLLAARVVAVLMGAIQLFVTKEIIKALGGRQKTQYFSMILFCILPFWFFYDRMALMDGMLTLLCCITVLGVIKLTQQKKLNIFLVVATGISIGAAIWTKLPALFLLPALPFFAFLQIKQKTSRRIQIATQSIIAGTIGVFLFAILRISPSFGQLFHRGNDFTFPIADVLLHGKWQITLSNIPTYFSYFANYSTLPILLLSFTGIFSNKHRRAVLCLLLAAAVFAGPFVLFGKVIYARYFLPSAAFLTISACLSLQGIYDRWLAEKVKITLTKKTVIGIGVALLLANTISTSFLFMGTALFNPDQIPFVGNDRTQYLEEWSSGHGIVQTVAYIRQQAASHTIAVATEGRFGTLPDGLLLFFHNTDVKNIYIEGTGEYPVKDIPDFFVQRAKNFDQSILVVNSHRMEIPLPQSDLIAQYCRPNNAPCLQIWDITSLVKNPPKATP